MPSVSAEHDNRTDCVLFSVAVFIKDYLAPHGVQSIVWVLRSLAVEVMQQIHTDTLARHLKCHSLQSVSEPGSQWPLMPFRAECFIQSCLKAL